MPDDSYRNSFNVANQRISEENSNDQSENYSDGFQEEDHAKGKENVLVSNQEQEASAEFNPILSPDIHGKGEAKQGSHQEVKLNSNEDFEPKENKNEDETKQAGEENTPAGPEKTEEENYEYYDEEDDYGQQ